MVERRCNRSGNPRTQRPPPYGAYDRSDHHDLNPATERRLMERWPVPDATAL